MYRRLLTRIFTPSPGPGWAMGVRHYPVKDWSLVTSQQLQRNSYNVVTDRIVCIGIKFSNFLLSGHSSISLLHQPTTPSPHPPSSVQLYSTLLCDGLIEYSQFSLSPLNFYVHGPFQVLPNRSILQWFSCLMSLWIIWWAFLFLFKRPAY